MDIDRDYIDFTDIKTINKVIREKVADLVSRGRTVPISAKSISSFESVVEWTYKNAVRQLLRNILEQQLGTSTDFEYEGKSAVAYLTRDGIDHSIGGPASPRKAAAFEVFSKLVRNAEYSYSSKNDKHSKNNKKIYGRID